MDFDLNRRHFVKLSLATLSGISLSPFTMGCGQNQAVVKPRKSKTVKLDSHPAISTPTNGCYLGWHRDIGYRISGANAYWLKEKSAQVEAQILNIYKNKIGALPAVHSIADDFLGNSYYPEGVLKAAVKMGVYPMMRYHPRVDWKMISQGDYDDQLQQFSQHVSQAALPAFFIPFPGVGHYDKNHLWEKWDPAYFIPAWERMHNIFEQQGANRYLVWGLHLNRTLSGGRKERPYYYVPSDMVDWVGISVWNQTIDRSIPLMELLGHDYTELTALYSNKPFAIWELGDRHRGTDWFYRYSSKWYERTYEAIETLPRCKLVVFYDYRLFDQGVENQLFTKRNVAMMQAVRSHGYYVSGGKNASQK